MLQSAQGSLTIVELSSATPQIFWNGERLNYIARVRAHHDGDDYNVAFRVADPTGAQEALYAQMEAAGITIKRAGA